MEVLWSTEITEKNETDNNAGHAESIERYYYTDNILKILYRYYYKDISWQDLWQD